jgi:hypothetical protein
MSRTFQFTVPDDIGAEIERYIYGKSGLQPSKHLPSMVLTMMAKNPLSGAQIDRVVRKYGKDASKSLAVAPEA